VEGFGGGIWWKNTVEALVEEFDAGKRWRRWERDTVEGFGRGIQWRKMVEALVERFGGEIRWGGKWWRDLREVNGGGKWWRR